MDSLKIRVKPGTLTGGFLSEQEIHRIAASMEVCLQPGDQIVHFGMNPPASTAKRWQETDSTGASVGQIKTYQGGAWV